MQPKKIEEFESDKVQMEIYECECGYHMGVDATYLDQVGKIRTICPSCKLTLDFE